MIDQAAIAGLIDTVKAKTPRQLLSADKCEQLRLLLLTYCQEKNSTIKLLGDGGLVDPSGLSKFFRGKAGMSAGKATRLLLFVQRESQVSDAIDNQEDGGRYADIINEESALTSLL